MGCEGKVWHQWGTPPRRGTRPLLAKTPPSLDAPHCPALPADSVVICCRNSLPRTGIVGDLREGREVFPLEPEVESGGAGLYGSAEDFAEVVRALLRGLAGEEGEGLLLGKEMVEEMFTPQLDETQRKWLKGILLRFGAAPEFPEDMPVDHGIGGVMNMEDIPGKRRKGSMKWTGMANSHWVSPSSDLRDMCFG